MPKILLKPGQHYDHADFLVKENSWLAKMAAWKLGACSMAMVLGSTIHLYDTTAREFLQNEKWLKHELCHIRQFKRHGYVIFIIKYIWETIRRGYYKNRFEVEARQAEENQLNNF